MLVLVLWSGLEHQEAANGGYNPVSRAVVAADGFEGIVDGAGARTCVVDAFIILMQLLLAILGTLSSPYDRRTTAVRIARQRLIVFAPRIVAAHTRDECDADLCHVCC